MQIDRTIEEDGFTRDIVFRAVAENAIDAVFVLDREGRATFANKAAEEMFGWSQSELSGHRLHNLIHGKRPDGSPYPIFDCPLNAVFASGQSLRLHDDVFYRRDGRAVAVTCTNSAIEREGEIIGGLLIVRDETERRFIEEQNELLRRELNHRVKNTLALVQAITHRSLRGVAPSSALKSLNSRLTALTDANKLLAEEAWVTPRVDVVVQRSLQPFEGTAERIGAEGPALNIEPSVAVALALTLHELATNAIKYGSLSTDKGSVRLRWQIDAKGNFELRWAEMDGPRVVEPNRRGFGTELMRRVWQGLGGTIRLRLSEDGLKALFCAPRERIEATEA